MTTTRLLELAARPALDDSATSLRSRGHGHGSASQGDDKKGAASSPPLCVWLVIIGSRVLVFLAGYLAVTQLPPAAYASRFIYASRLLLSGMPGRWLNAWANWDGQWYLGISRLGYTTGQSTAFFPLYPVFVRGLAPLFAHSSLIAGVALSVAFFVAAMYLLYRLIVIDYGPRVAAWTVVFASLFPTSFFFQAVYTESLFLLTTVACLFFARREQWLWAGLAGFCAALTRNTGVLLLLPMTMFYFGARDGKLRFQDRQLAWFALVPTGLLVWMGYLQIRFGDPFAFLKAQAHWGRSLSAPWITLDHGLVRGVAGIATLVRHGLGTPKPDPHGTVIIPVVLPDALALVVLVAIVVVLALTARTLKRPYLMYTIAALVVPLFSATSRQPLFSLPRFVLVMFPVFAGLALLTRHHRVTRLVLLVTFALALVLLTTVFVRFYFVA
jgi:hypothetical protein